MFADGCSLGTDDFFCVNLIMYLRGGGDYHGDSVRGSAPRPRPSSIRSTLDATRCSPPSTRCEDAARRLGVRLRVVVCHEDARIVDIVDGRVVELVLQRVAHGGRHRVLDALAVLAHDLCRNQISRCLDSCSLPTHCLICAQVATTRTRKTVWTSLASGVQYNGYVE